MNYQNIFDTHIAGTLKLATGLLSKYPKSIKALLKISAHEAKAKKIRSKWLDEGICVPPLLIVSTTQSCNLKCKGCYSANVCRESKTELAKERIAELLDEASTVGCSTVLLAGGEPLLAPDWMNSAAEHNELLGLVFINGTLFDERWYEFFSSHRNMIVLFSVEGSHERTDGRRGSGVIEKIKAAMAELQNKKIPFGISVTTDSHNIDEVICEGFIDPYIELGCRLVIHVEYVPISENDELLPLSEIEKACLSEYCYMQSRSGKAIFIAFPGNEDVYGGCLAAGRGFLHISTFGLLEPCPFAPYSDRDLSKISFIEALKSPLLNALRAEANSLHEGVGGCSLRNKEAWISKILSEES